MVRKTHEARTIGERAQFAMMKAADIIAVIESKNGL